jgi:hypothetical protein
MLYGTVVIISVSAGSDKKDKSVIIPVHNFQRIHRMVPVKIFTSGIPNTAPDGNLSCSRFCIKIIQDSGLQMIILKQSVRRLENFKVSS